MTRHRRPASGTPRLSALARQPNPGMRGEPQFGADQTLHILHVTPHEIVALKPAGLASELPRDPAADSFVRRLAAQGLSGWTRRPLA